MNIFLRELKANRKSLIFWCIGMVFMIIAGMAKYSGFEGSPQAVNGLMSQIPKAIQAVIGIGTFDLAKASGFYAVIYLYLILMSTIHASMLGANIISKEERDKTAEFLYVRPVSRDRIITSKLLAGFFNVLILNIFTLIFSIGIVGYYAKGEAITGDILKLMLGMLILQLMFMAIGMGISAISKRPKAAPTITSAILLSTFMLSVAIDINSSIEGLKYITPFKYYEAKNLMYGGSFNLLFLLISILIIAAMTSITYSFLRKRDLHL